MLVTAKHLGLSFADLNLLSMDDFVSFADMSTAGMPEQEEFRMATQSDINRLLG